MTPKERHEEAAAVAAHEGCICRGPKPELLCSDYLNGLSCTRHRGHDGIHVACAGELGPHAISSWERPKIHLHIDKGESR